MAFRTRLTASVSTIAALIFRTVAVALLVGAGMIAPDMVHAQPANDNFANRIRIASPGTVTGTNVGATRETGEPRIDLSDRHTTSVWWTFTPTASGLLVINTNNTDFRHWLALYTGSSLTSLSRIDEKEGFAGSRGAEIEVEVVAGVPIQIVVAGSLGPTGGVSGRITLNVQLFSNRGATTAVLSGRTLESNRGDFVGHEVRITAESGAVNAIVSWRANGEQYASDRVRGFFSRGTRDLPVGVNRLTVFYPGNRETAPTTSNVLLHTVGGPSVQPNDDFANRIRIAAPGTVRGSNVGTTHEVGEPRVTGRRSYRTVWWTYTPQRSGQLTIDTVGSSFDTMLGVYTGSSLPNLVLVAENDNIILGNSRSQVSFAAVAGRTYQISVSSGWLGRYEGDIVLNLALSAGTGPQPTQTTLTGPTTGISGGLLTFQATVTSGSGTPGGQVSFRNGTAEFARVTLSAQGRASAETRTLPLGTNSVSAHYLGSTGFAASSSAARTVTISQPNFFFIGGGAVFAPTPECGAAFVSASPHPVQVRYSPAEMNGFPSQVSLFWADGSEHLALWGPMAASGSFLGAAGRSVWTRFIFYPVRPLMRVVQRQILAPVSAPLFQAQHISLRIRVQNFSARRGCSVTIAAILTRP